LLPGLSTDILPSNGHPIVLTRFSLKVCTGSLPSTGHPIVAYSLPIDMFIGPLHSNRCPSIVGHALVGTCLPTRCLAGVKCFTIFIDYTPNWNVLKNFIVKLCNVKFNGNPFVCSRVTTCGHRHGETNRRFPATIHLKRAKNEYWVSERTFLNDNPGAWPFSAM
jgi:hypothetical protein